MAKDYIIERLIKEFKGRESFSREELFDFYRQFEPDLKETTFRWRIYHLKGNKIITAIKRGLFTFSFKPIFKPEIGEVEKKISIKIEKQFNQLKYCIWSTKITHEFMLHIPGKVITILQVEKDAIEPVYSFLKEENILNIFIKPEDKEIERYIYEVENAIVLISLVSKSPIQKINKVATTTLEKLMVDLYCDKKLFAAFQGSELVHILNNAYNRYSIDFTKLFNYSKRRRKETELMAFFIDKTDIPNTIFND
ncbi:MAG: hypothetical protein IT245_08290 [Bacteroidia bacterium]|nr:hypothetical protein [Bacteroidia bacterium]